MKKLLSVGLAVVCATPVAHAKEFLYVIRGDLFVYDPATGDHLITQDYAVPSRYSHASGSLEYDGARLLSMSYGHLDHLFTIHPAGARSTYIGSTTFQWVWRNLGRNPVDGALYTIGVPLPGEIHLYLIDSNTGKATSLGVIDNAPQLGVTALAFDANGVAYVASHFGGGRIHSLDLTTLELTQVGTFPELNNGWFFDLAIDSSGQLWVSFNDVGTGVETGIHRLDIANGTSVRVVSLPSPALGLTFAPGCFGETYCTAKTNTLGCLPEIDSWGQASSSTDRGFELSASNVRNNVFGALIYSTSGPASLPFLGGTLCVDRRFEVAAAVNAGGSTPPAVDCSGKWSMDFNAFLSEQGGPKPAPGSMLYLQWLGRDAGGKATLTDAIRIEVCQ